MHQTSPRQADTVSLDRLWQINVMAPIRRIAELEEVAALVTFLAGPNAGYMTGGVIDVAGGFGI